MAGRVGFRSGSLDTPPAALVPGPRYLRNLDFAAGPRRGLEAERGHVHRVEADDGDLESGAVAAAAFDSTARAPGFQTPTRRRAMPVSTASAAACMALPRSCVSRTPRGGRCGLCAPKRQKVHWEGQGALTVVKGQSAGEAEGGVLAEGEPHGAGAGVDGGLARLGTKFLDCRHRGHENRRLADLRRVQRLLGAVAALGQPRSGDWRSPIGVAYGRAPLELRLDSQVVADNLGRASEERRRRGHRRARLDGLRARSRPRGGRVGKRTMPTA
jgi:hypothetical protein